MTDIKRPESFGPVVDQRQLSHTDATVQPRDPPLLDQPTVGEPSRPAADANVATAYDSPDSRNGLASPLESTPSSASTPANLANDRTVISGRAPYHDFSAINGPPGDTPLEDLLVGRQLEHFLIEQLIGGGGMGAVFRGTDLQLGRPVAVKVLVHHIGTDAETVRRFRLEAQSAARLNHENIAQVYFVGEDEGWNFIVYEFIDGKNIRDLVFENGPLPLDVAVDYVLQVTAALDHAFARNVVHRDVKPSNIVVTADGQVKLVDMGLARLHQVETGEDDLTSSGVTLGTFDYISPEQGRDPRCADIRSDLYSLGCTLYVMLTGQPPFPEGTVLQKLLMHTGDTPPDPRFLRPNIPDDLLGILMKLLEKSPDNRYQLPSELVGDLARVIERHGMALSVPSVTLVSPARSVKHTSQLWRQVIPIVIPVFLLLAMAILPDWKTSAKDVASETIPEFVVSDERKGNSENSTFSPQIDVERVGKAATDPAGPISPPPSHANLSIKANGNRASEAATDDPLPVRDETTPDDERPRQGSSTSTVPSPDPSVPDSLPSERGAVESGDTPINQRSGSDNSDGDASADGPKPPAPDYPSGEANATSTQRNHAEPMTIPDMPTQNGVRVVVVREPTELGPEIESLPSDTVVVKRFAQACDLAADNPELEAIELKFNGLRQARPITFTNLDLTLRAAAGYRPVLLFQPEIGDPTQFPTNMIQVVGGSLRIEGVHIAWFLPETPVERWSLFHLKNVQLLKLSDSWITVHGWPRGPDYFADVSVVETAIPMASDDVSPKTDPMDGPQTEILLRNCVVRGNADVLSCPQSLPLRLSWTNGMLATSHRLLTLYGTDASPQHGENIQIDLDHLTAVADAGLCRIQNSRSARNWLPVGLNCTHCIFVTPSEVPLVEHAASEMALDDIDEYLFFSGERNFYEQVGVFWHKFAQDARDIADSRQEEKLGFEDWQGFWGSFERLSQWNKVRWRHPPEESLARHEMIPSDLALDTRPGNPAKESSAGVDRRDAGFDATELPPNPFSRFDLP